MTPGTNLPESYEDLLLRLQPRSIKSDEDAERIQRQIDALIDKGILSPGEQEMLSLLGDLVQVWEDDRFDLPDLPPSRMIQALLEEHDMESSALIGPVFQTEAAMSAVLSGNEQPSYDQVDNLARIFHVSPAVFYSAQHGVGAA